MWQIVTTTNSPNATCTIVNNSGSCAIQFNSHPIIIPLKIVGQSEVINNAKTIFLNGTAGKYELENFETGTKAVLELVSKSNAYTVIGGGDALSSSEYFNIDGFSFKSTGGGATLDYIANGKLKCLEDENTNNWDLCF